MITQPQSYHNFADQRSLKFSGLEIKNAGDVLSNIPFALVGLYILFWTPSNLINLTMSLGMILTSLGSTWYHWNPNNQSLFWDRLGMTVVMFPLTTWILDTIYNLQGRWIPLHYLLFGGICLGSVIYWRQTGDLLPYLIVQGFPMYLVLHMEFNIETYKFYISLFIYIMAKISELGDHQLYRRCQGLISGHTLKHILAALSILILF